MSRLSPAPSTAPPDLPTEPLDCPRRHPDRRTRREAAPEPDVPGRYLLIEGPQETQLVELSPGVTRVGRGYAADVRIEDQSVSRRHSILVSRAGGVRVLDDRSVNGTFVNGRRVAQAELEDGDVLVLGRVVLLYRHVPAGHSPSRSSAQAGRRQLGDRARPRPVTMVDRRTRGALAAVGL
jgi:pSer/pThr/pTyr-binding forkhead associated (FHA) protein